MEFQLDHKYINNLVNEGKKVLAQNDLSNIKRKKISKDIEVLNCFLKKDFVSEENIEASKSFKDMEIIKKHVLYKMKKQYVMLGERLINYLIELNDLDIFSFYDYMDNTELSTEEIVNLTLNNYEYHSEYFFNYAKKYLLDPISKIQSTENFDVGSFCFYPTINSIPLIFVDFSEEAYSLNHEIQHAIESILRFPTNIFFGELGPIYFEMLFNDLLYEKNGYLLSGDYAFRLEDTGSYLCDLSIYFKIMKIFAEDNFLVSLEKFKRVFAEYYDISIDDLELYLLNYIDDFSKEVDINYLLSHLKALELRDVSKQYDGDKFNILKPYLKSKKIIYNPSLSNFKIYEEYIEEMQCKTKRR